MQIGTRQNTNQSNLGAVTLLLFTPPSTNEALFSGRRLFLLLQLSIILLYRFLIPHMPPSKQQSSLGIQFEWFLRKQEIGKGHNPWYYPPSNLFLVVLYPLTAIPRPIPMDISLVTLSFGADDTGFTLAISYTQHKPQQATKFSQFLHTTCGVRHS